MHFWIAIMLTISALTAWSKKAFLKSMEIIGDEWKVDKFGIFETFSLVFLVQI